ncbi:hypothetical protein SAMN05443246_5811 [Paenibacillus sp. GP183]|jgi:hypothetical protein|nr:hypothetical protein SAMN05443246_5811 [Paenibacillus sp. GP183]
MGIIGNLISILITIYLIKTTKSPRAWKLAFIMTFLYLIIYFNIDKYYIPLNYTLFSVFTLIIGIIYVAIFFKFVFIK